MNHRIVAKYMGYIMLVEGLFMIPSVFVSLWFGEPDTIKAFLPAIAVPLRPCSCIGISISDGLVTSRRPFPVISKTASSEVEPKRFLILLKSLYDPLSSPSN